jgi:penicillin-binding protein 1C
MRLLLWCAEGVRRARAYVRRVGAVLVLVGASWLAWRALRLVAGAPTLGYEGASIMLTDHLGRPLLEVAPRGQVTHARPVALEQISPRLVEAVLLAEDRSFASHDGVDRMALGRAVLQNLWHRRRVSGASTLTAQLVKTLDGAYAERSWSRKLYETARAQNLEARYSKSQILEAYMNRVELGHGVRGFDAASRLYFGVPAAHLTWCEATLLAVLPRAPAKLDLYSHLDRARARQAKLLHMLAARSRVEGADVAACLRTPPRINPPHAKAARIGWGRALRALHGAPNQHARAELALTLDPDLQGSFEAALDAERGTARGNVGGPTGMAALMVDNASGSILALASVSDDPSSRPLDVVRDRRSPGSLLKPFVYLRALERRRAVDLDVTDTPLAFTGPWGTYHPQNFDGGWRGELPFTTALAESLNLPAVAVARDLGAVDVERVLRRFGLRGAAGSASRAGVAVALGAAEVSMLDVATAYVALARGGRVVTPTLLRGATPLTWFASAALPAEAITRALSDPAARAPLLPAGAQVQEGVALKTGTSAGYRDAWCAAYTKSRTVVVWAGRLDGGEMHACAGCAVTGGHLAAPIALRLLGTSSQGAAPLPVARHSHPSPHRPRSLPMQIIYPLPQAVLRVGADGVGHVAVQVAGVAPASLTLILDGRSAHATGPQYQGIQPMAEASTARWLAVTPGSHELVVYDADGRFAQVRFSAQ